MELVRLPDAEGRIAAKVRFLILRVCCVLFRVKSGGCCSALLQRSGRRDQPAARFAPELQGVYIEEHDGRKQVWCMSSSLVMRKAPC